MGRMKKVRFCRRAPGYRFYKPGGVPLRDLAVVELLLDELEAMRLVDLEGKDQQAAADLMGISRGTLQRLLWEARRKVAGALVHGQALAVADAEHVVVRPPGRRGGFPRGGRGA